MCNGENPRKLVDLVGVFRNHHVIQCTVKKVPDKLRYIYKDYMGPMCLNKSRSNAKSILLRGSCRPSTLFVVFGTSSRLKAADPMGRGVCPTTYKWSCISYKWAYIW